MVRFLMVVPRYGPEVLGGAENLIRGLATRAVGPEDVVDVATTCAVDHETWENVLPAGESHDGAIRVMRFPTAERDTTRHDTLLARLMLTGALTYAEELDLMATSVWSPGLQAFIEQEGDAYDLIVFAPYLFGTTYWGTQAWPGRTALVPCLHDEPYAYMTCIREMVEGVAGCMFNSAAEERLARRLYRVRSGGVVGLGFDPPSGAADPTFVKRNGLGRYLIYAGRLEEGKGVSTAVDFTARYAAERCPGLRLVLLGRGSYRVPRDKEKWVVNVGYVSEDDKRSALGGAVAMVHPSRLESLSIVLMESWLEGTPALVSAESEVMVDHCRRSGAGVEFSDYGDFAAKLDTLLRDDAARADMGRRGATYVLEEYGWPAVRQRFARTASLIPCVST
jgi:glycosyltransferase involved in cell wall biosynthesis